MPFISNENTQSVLPKFNAPEMEEQDFSFGEKLQAAWRTENWIGSKMFELPKPDQGVVDNNYNVFDSLTEDELQDENFLDELIYLESPAQLDWARKQRNRETVEKQKLTSWDGFLATFISGGLADPISYIGPGGAAYRTYKIGESILKGGITTGLVTAGTVAVQEALLHESQVTRTHGESAMNITAASLLGAVLGGSVAGISASRRAAMVSELEDIMTYKDTANPTGEKSIGAAEFMGDVKIKGGVASKLAEWFPYNPLVRGLTSESQAMRKATVQMFENPVDVDNFTGQAWESRAKTRHYGMLSRALSKHRDQYKLHRKAGGKLKLREYNELVSKEIRNPGSVDDPNIKQSSAAFTEEIYAKTMADMQETGLLPEDVDPKTAMEYLNRRWNKEKVAANFPDFVATTKQWLHEQYNVKNEAQLKIDKLDTGLQAADKKLTQLANRHTTAKTKVSTLEGKINELNKVQGGERRIKALQKQLTDAKKRMASLEDDLAKTGDDYLMTARDIEDIMTELPSPIAKKVRERVKARDGEELLRMYKDLKKAVAKVKKANYSDMMDDAELEQLAMEIGNRIMGSPDGMLPYSYKIGDHTDATGSGSSTLRAPFKKRVFMIPDERVAQFLDNDIEELAGVYLRQTAADIEMVKMFGDPKTPVEETLQGNNFIRDIQDDYAAKLIEAPDEATRSKLLKQRDRDIRDFAAMRDRTRGVYAMPDPNSMPHRIMTAARNINFLRLMGGVAVSSFPDMARLVMSEGVLRTFGTLLRPMIKGVKGAKPAAMDVKYWGIGTDAITGGRLEIISDINNYALGNTKFERGLQSMANSYGNINMMNQWTGLMKTTHAVSMQARIMDELVKGKINRNLKRLGINDANAMAIRDQVLKYGRKDGNAWIFNAKEWDNPELAMMWGSALRKESDRVIIVPGQEKPLFMSTEGGKTLFQFQSFMMSATQRVTMAALQKQDEHLISGAIAMIGFGAMTYAFKQWEAGREISGDPAVWVAEGIDRSGALGVFMEMNNTLEKISNNRFGLRPLIGVSAPASRYASRNMVEAMAGPTFGSSLSTTLKIMSAATSDKEWSENDTAAIRRMLPYQNLSIFRKGLNEVESKVNEALGVTK